MPRLLESWASEGSTLTSLARWSSCPRSSAFTFDAGTVVTSECLEIMLRGFKPFSICAQQSRVLHPTLRGSPRLWAKGVYPRTLGPTTHIPSSSNLRSLSSSPQFRKPPSGVEADPEEISRPQKQKRKHQRSPAAKNSLRRVAVEAQRSKDGNEVRQAASQEPRPTTKVRRFAHSTFIRSKLTGS